MENSYMEQTEDRSPRNDNVKHQMIKWPVHQRSQMSQRETCRTHRVSGSGQSLRAEREVKMQMSS